MAAHVDLREALQPYGSRPIQVLAERQKELLAATHAIVARSVASLTDAALRQGRLAELLQGTGCEDEDQVRQQFGDEPAERLTEALERWHAVDEAEADASPLKKAALQGEFAAWIEACEVAPRARADFVLAMIHAITAKRSASYLAAKAALAERVTLELDIWPDHH